MPGRTLRRPSSRRDNDVATEQERFARRQRDEDQPDEATDDQPEEPSRRGSSSRPARRSAPAPRRDEEDEKPARSRRGGSRSRDEDEDDADDNGSATSGGWGSWREKRAALSNFGEEFKVDYKRRYLIRILDDEPYTTFGQHWLDDMPKGERKSYVCLGQDCPLCDILGADSETKAKPLARFNVVEFVEEKRDGETFMVPKHKFWEIGPGVAQILQDYDDDPKMSPLSDFYWQVSKSKTSKKGPTNYQITQVKERDLWDDWGAEELTDEELNDFLNKRFTASSIRKDTAEELAEIAEDYVNS